jgi:hypothetical protein
MPWGKGLVIVGERDSLTCRLRVRVGSVSSGLALNDIN